jgi:hypothetical protein
MAQRAKVLRRFKPIDLLEAQRDHHGLGKGEFKPSGQALHADVLGVLFQKPGHGLVILQVCDAVPIQCQARENCRRTTFHEVSEPDRISDRAFVPDLFAEPTGILPLSTAVGWLCPDFRLPGGALFPEDKTRVGRPRRQGRVSKIAAVIDSAPMWRYAAV